MRVFAYGSLVVLPGERATLPGHRRTWGAAMDNAVALPGYKRYLDPAIGVHPDVRVAFLALAADPTTAVDGVLLEVDDDGLAALDRREANYDRTVVTVTSGERAWTYLPSESGAARCSRHPVVVARAYRDAVRTAYATLGPDALRAFDASTDPPPPLADLRVETTEGLSPDPPIIVDESAATSRSRRENRWIRAQVKPATRHSPPTRSSAIPGPNGFPPGTIS